MLTALSPLSQAGGQAGGEKGPERWVCHQPHADCACALPLPGAGQPWLPACGMLGGFPNLAERQAPRVISRQTQP